MPELIGRKRVGIPLPAVAKIIGHRRQADIGVVSVHAKAGDRPEDPVAKEYPADRLEAIPAFGLFEFHGLAQFERLARIFGISCRDRRVGLEISDYPRRLDDPLRPRA